jgi:2-dehydro-3-deoxygluconokinase
MRRISRLVSGLRSRVPIDNLRVALDGYKKMIERATQTYPNSRWWLHPAYGESATINSWGAICWAEGRINEATHREDLEIFDRVGGGDSFASGLAYGFLTYNDAAVAVEYGAAHGALAMTTPGDTSMATKAEVEKLVKGGGARVDR